MRFLFISPLHLRSADLCSIGLLLVMQHHPQRPAYIQFLFVGANICRLLPSDSTSQWTPLLLANTSYCLVCSGLAPYSSYTCLTHKKNNLVGYFFRKFLNLMSDCVFINKRAYNSAQIGRSRFFHIYPFPMFISK